MRNCNGSTFKTRIAMVRLLKPLQYYKDKYGTAFYGLNKMYLLMEKQHNRGQDGAGIASLKYNVTPGTLTKRNLYKIFLLKLTIVLMVFLIKTLKN